MPYVGEDVQPPRKRRWDDGTGDLYKLYEPEKAGSVYLLNHLADYAPRKVLPLSKRARILTDDGMHISDDLAPTHRRRSSLQKQSQIQHESVGGRPILRAAETSLLPCHICHRRPTKKSDLDSFADCQGCGERACFVCIRQCSGWGAGERPAPHEEDALSRSFHMDDVDDLLSNQHQQHNHSHTFDGAAQKEKEVMAGDGRQPSDPKGDLQTPKGGWTMGGHRTMVCSRCCVEKGAEGEVVCLGCLSRMEGA